MEIRIDIDEKEIKEAIKDVVISRTVEKVEKSLFRDEFGNYDRRLYVDAIKKEVREVMKEHKDDIVNRAVAYAGVYIGKKGFKKMVDEDQI